MTSLCVPNFDSAPSSMPRFWPINHFPQVNPLVPGLKLLESFYSFDFGLRLTLYSHLVPLWSRVGEDPGNEIALVPQEKKKVSLIFVHNPLFCLHYPETHPHKNKYRSL